MAFIALHHRDYDVVCTEDYGRIQISLILGIMRACGLPCVPGSLSSLPAPAPEESLGTRLDITAAVVRENSWEINTASGEITRK